MNRKKRKESIPIQLLIVLIGFSVFFGLLIGNNVNAADPQSPDILNVTSNTTKPAPTAQMVNVSGGRVVHMNLTASTQNPRWKAFIGHVIGKFTLQDSSGAEIYDWTLSSNTGRVYATRNTSSPNWTAVNCSNLTHLNTENSNLEHTNVNDNLTITFNVTATATHAAFYVGGVYINANSCPTLNTYKNNASQDDDFEEVALYDNHNVFFAAILENDMQGYDSLDYDFQMIVPENGNSSKSVSTAYYIYVEVGT
ncbi:hypothetical protein GOV12_06685 [Candidatus Pacearchaeota archaeon]|nr:hypothetical protein [Candidatus Pacearchaeota archaeon]